MKSVQVKKATLKVQKVTFIYFKSLSLKIHAWVESNASVAMPNNPFIWLGDEFKTFMNTMASKKL